MVVEGYFDVLRLVEVSVENVVAPLGTAFTEEQAQLIKRFCKDVILLYDSDTAGLRATFRAADELLGAGLRVSIATRPVGEDPDTLAAAGGAEAIKALLDHGFPKEKVSYYRGGMQMWRILGLTVVTPKEEKAVALK